MWTCHVPTWERQLGPSQWLWHFLGMLKSPRSAECRVSGPAASGCAFPAASRRRLCVSDLGGPGSGMSPAPAQMHRGRHSAEFN